MFQFKDETAKLIYPTAKIDIDLDIHFNNKNNTNYKMNLDINNNIKALNLSESEVIKIESKVLENWCQMYKYV